MMGICEAYLIPQGCHSFGRSHTRCRLRRRELRSQSKVTTSTRRMAGRPTNTWSRDWPAGADADAAPANRAVPCQRTVSRLTGALTLPAATRQSVVAAKLVIVDVSGRADLHESQIT